MNIKSITKYNICISFKSLLIFSIVFTASSFFFSILPFLMGEQNVTMGGMDFSSSIFTFVLGIVLLREGFHFGIANSVTRKEFFIGLVLTFIPLGFVLKLVDYLCLLISSFFVETKSYITFLYPSRYEGIADFSFFFDTIVIGTVQLFFIALIGVLISLFYYKANKMIKIVVSFLTPALLIFGFPILDEFVLNGAISKWLPNALMTILGIKNDMPHISLITFLVGGVALAGIEYLIFRRTAVKKK